LAPDTERLLRTREHVDEEHDAAVEEEGLDEARLGQNGVVEDVKLVQCCEDVGLLRSEFFLQSESSVMYMSYRGRLETSYYMTK
jgi:hypothetical protein